MTINERLQVSVLSAPIATIDPGALSQAWYSALFGVRVRTAPAQIKTTTPIAAPRICTKSTARAQWPQCPAAGSARCSQQRDRTRLHAVPQARVLGTRLAGKIQRALTRHPLTLKAASFTLRSAGQRVHFIVRWQGSRVWLTALCTREQCAQVESALRHVRFALGRSGMTVQSQMRAVAC